MHAIAAFLCGLMAVLSYASAQEMPHIHGVTVPDWYDADCCNNKDCHLLEAPDKIEIVGDVGYTEHDEDEGTDRPVKVFLYRNTRPADGARAYYRKDQLRASQDERYHVCHSSTPYPRQELGGTQMENIVNGYCLYVPGLV